MEIVFYHLRKTPIISSLPKFVAKIYDLGEKICIKCNSEQQMLELDQVLWTTPANAFIPHDIANNCQNPEDHPVLLYLNTNDSEMNINLNNASICIDLTSKKINQDIKLNKYLYFFYGNEDDHSVISAYDLYKSYQKMDYKVIFWQQDDNLKWIQS